MRRQQGGQGRKKGRKRAGEERERERSQRGLGSNKGVKGGESKKDKEEEIGGGRSEKMDVQMDAERAGRKTRKELEKKSEKGEREEDEGG